MLVTYAVTPADYASTTNSCRVMTRWLCTGTGPRSVSMS